MYDTVQYIPMEEMTMKLDFTRKNMDIGTPAFLWMRAMMAASAAGADVAECLEPLAEIKESGDASWVAAWKALADRRRADAGTWLDKGLSVSGRDAMLRAASYYRSALIRCPESSRSWTELLDASRECFETAAALFDPPIEVVRIPWGDCILPGYYLSSGKANAPTLICANGGDSTNEELFPVFGFGARERGWNILVFEGPGQYTAAQLNPTLHLSADFEKPTGAVIDWLLARPEVDPKRIALFGWSLSSNLAMRAAAFDDRIAAVISNGLVVDVYEAWYGIWPLWLRRAKPKDFDRVFHFLEKSSPQVRALTSVFYRLLGADTPSSMIAAWKPFDISKIADRVRCPVLFIAGEAEYAEQSAGPLILSIARFMGALKAPAWIREFGFESGWAAAHCQIGASTALRDCVYDWLDMVLARPDRLTKEPERWHDFARAGAYFGKMPGLAELLSKIRIRSF
jgi:pimeloyl-ACP methyl ester carboxylesterase